MHRAARASAALALAAVQAAAQERAASHCVALSGAGPERLHRATSGAPLAADTVRLSYADHATFVLETAGGLTAATDFTGSLGRTDHIPDVIG